jgi:hypothetical protein
MSGDVALQYKGSKADTDSKATMQNQSVLAHDSQSRCLGEYFEGCDEGRPIMARQFEWKKTRYANSTNVCGIKASFKVVEDVFDVMGTGSKCSRRNTSQGSPNCVPIETTDEYHESTRPWECSQKSFPFSR